MPFDPDFRDFLEATAGSISVYRRESGVPKSWLSNTRMTVKPALLVKHIDAPNVLVSAK